MYGAQKYSIDLDGYKPLSNLKLKWLIAITELHKGNV